MRIVVGLVPLFIANCAFGMKKKSLGVHGSEIVPIVSQIINLLNPQALSKDQIDAVIRILHEYEPELTREQKTVLGKTAKETQRLFKFFWGKQVSQVLPNWGRLMTHFVLEH